MSGRTNGSYTVGDEIYIKAKIIASRTTLGTNDVVDTQYKLRIESDETWSTSFELFEEDLDMIIDNRSGNACSGSCEKEDH